jgi:hypothetical protein
MTLAISIDEIVSIVNEIDREYSIDWATLAVDEGSATNLLAISILDQYNNTWSKFNQKDKDLIMLASIVQLLLENFVLNLKLRQ